MTEQQSKDLAAVIRLQLPFHDVRALDSNDTRKAPYHWFVAVSREPEGQSLILHSRYDWDQALLAWEIIRD